MLGTIKVQIAKNLMTASACIDEGNQILTRELVEEALSEAGVKIGLDYDAIDEMLDWMVYRKWYVVARGQVPGDTVHGYFEYLFDTSHQKDKTVINEDGTVSYGKYRAMVQKDAKIAEYHPPVTGKFGYTVVSSVIAPKPAKQAMLRCGEGVRKEENSYYANVDGEVILQSDTISVKGTLLINGDAKYGIDSGTDFIGNIHVTGDVLQGVSLTASGNIDVDGTVEGADLSAGGSIVIRGGIKGDEKARICANGTIVCPFIENALVEAGGNIRADYVLNSQLESENSIILKGKRGVIIGGVAKAKNEIIADEVGNNIGVRTCLEIENDNLELIDKSRIIIHEMVYDNVNIFIGRAAIRSMIQPRMEYHLVDGVIRAYPIGHYVEQIERSRPKQEKKTILLVDDEPIILKTFYGFLAENYNVMLATSAKDAVAQMEKRVPDLILLDYQMPVMNGAQFLEFIRKANWKNYSNVPVIFVTAATDKQTIKKCLNLYPQGYLIKPLGKEDIQKAVSSFFDNKKS